ncbi:MAG: glycosyltransferase, exosortase A system-associated, partial [Thermoanaerobaculia bacterium]|nr:glycosyltransferase, exosortase A system-associated [Thermoanaerobaculia bacterium]
MRILHVLDHSLPVHTGYTFRTRSILLEQGRLGWETIQLTGSKHELDGPDPEEADGLLFHRSPRPTTPLARLPVWNQYEVVRTLERRLDPLIEAYRPDILHAHSPALNGIAALRAARRHGKPVVYECRAFWEDAAVDHGTTREGSLRYRLTRALETRVFQRADRVTCICEGLRREIVGRGVAAGKVTVIPNAVNVESFGQAAAPDPALADSLGLTGHPVLGFIGSFYAYEGLSLAIEALSRLSERLPGVRLLLVGGGPQEENLRRQIETTDLGERVIFTGRVPHTEVPRYYDLIDVLIYPRLSKRITELVTPLKPLEAMAQRRLVLASDVGGHRELIRDGETGRLFRAGSAAA